MNAVFLFASAQMIIEIGIQVASEYRPDLSDVMRDRYAFAYHITIQNRSPETVTLRRRHWDITDAHGKRQTVEGAGVVGEQPRLLPGQIFEYSSSVILDAPWGEMRGRYLFEIADGSQAWAPIEPFALKAEFTLQ